MLGKELMWTFSSVLFIYTNMNLLTFIVVVSLHRNELYEQMNKMNEEMRKNGNSNNNEQQEHKKSNDDNNTNDDHNNINNNTSHHIESEELLTLKEQLSEVMFIYMSL